MESAPPPHASTSVIITNAQALASGKPLLCVVVGDKGVGKSSLLYVWKVSPRACPLRIVTLRCGSWCIGLMGVAWWCGGAAEQHVFGVGRA